VGCRWAASKGAAAAAPVNAVAKLRRVTGKMGYWLLVITASLPAHRNAMLGRISIRFGSGWLASMVGFAEARTGLLH
jgi:hypothetical protein